LISRWEVAAAPAGAFADPAGLDGLAWLPATVPGTAASALRAAGAWSWADDRRFDAEDWWWRTSLPGEPAPGVLHLDGIATLWDAWIDGEHAGSGDNMFRAYQLPLPAGARRLVIRCRALEPELARKRPRPRWRVPMLEQQQLRWIRTTLLGRTPGWSPRCPPVGPWRPVWIGPAPAEQVEIDARLDAGAGTVACRAVIDADACTLVVSRGAERHAAALAATGEAWTGTLTIERPALWWPHTHGRPDRYDAVLEVQRGGDTRTVPLRAVGFRSIELERELEREPDRGGEFGLRVNGVRVFCRGACWTPLDVVSLAATPAEYATAVAQLCDAGMNMIRIGGTMVYEDDALYDELDAQGVLLWQDLMFANMDYPDDPAFVAGVELEVDHQLARLAGRPSLAIVCGNSEGEQQAAMWGAARELWTPRLFHDVLARRCRDVPYVASSATGGAFPHAVNAGPASYYGVGAYLRPLDDARRAEVRFASECLGFANVPDDPALPPVHDPAWKAGTPRDRGADWDFDDVRDHYVQRVFGVDPAALRAADPARYLELARVATGEVMARVFDEWRRARSTCRGGLVWFLRDLRPGAGWGLIDVRGTPKPCWYVARRALAPIGLALTDEGSNGLAIHVANDRAEPLAGRLELTLWRGDLRLRDAATEIAVAPHAAIELAANAQFDSWIDLSYTYRFGPPAADVVHARLRAGDDVVETHWFPAGLSAAREPDVGLAVTGDAGALAITTRRFARFVAIDAPGYMPSDSYFHLAPDQRRTITLTGDGPLRVAIRALNSEAGATGGSP
jgi:beta-mannosidase